MSQIKVTTTGKVGIGMNTPTYKLDLTGTARFAVHGQGWDDIILNANNQWGTPQLYCPTENFTIGTSIYPLSGTFRHIYYYYLHNLSDARVKTNIKSLSNSLEKIMQISGKSYNFIDNSKEMRIESLKEQNTKLNFGFIAQELIEVFPELVNEPNEFCEYYTVNYNGIIPVLVEAIKEQQNRIEYLQTIIHNGIVPKQGTEDQQQIIEALQQKVENLENALMRCCQNNAYNTGENQNFATSYVSYVTDEEMKIFQNAPNPFNERTTIQCYIPQTIQKVDLCVYNMQGAQVKCFTVSERGMVNVQIEAGQLSAGIYTYLLVGNGKTSDAKQMILTK